jgi:hypothetical protein
MANQVLQNGNVVMVGGQPYYSNYNIPPAFQNIAKRDLYRIARSDQGLESLINQKQLIPLGMSGNNNQQTSNLNISRPIFTPNTTTQAQLAGMGGGATPQWMYNAYSNKIGNMGGNANQPPFQITQSGFPGSGGKTAPAQGQ